MAIDLLELTRARESRAAIERLYIEMRHLFNRGSYRQLGASGEVLTDALKTLSPEIYGSLNDFEKVELDGLVYVINRLPKGIESCRFIRLISEEGFSETNFEAIVPLARRRNCYRIDEERMFIEVTRGRSEIYDILTHLTFLYVEGEKIRLHAMDEEGSPTPEWLKLEQIVKGETKLTEHNQELALTYLSTILGRTLEETRNAFERLDAHPDRNSGLFHVIYGLGKLDIAEDRDHRYREISFSPTLRTRIGHHIHGERWASRIKEYLREHDLLERPLHIISANLHSVRNAFYAWPALQKSWRRGISLIDMAKKLSNSKYANLNEQVLTYARQNGMHQLEDLSGTNISVQIFDLARIRLDQLHKDLSYNEAYLKDEKPVILVMDYAFGEQAYETMDELLKPYKAQDGITHMKVCSISIMGKAGILHGGKGDIMVPNAHIFEGTADNYPFENELTFEDLSGHGLQVYEGPMVTVLGTSLQNRDVLSYFCNSSWRAIGLEMEGAHYQKAIQSAALIRKSISRNVRLRYAYYASDNPLISGSTLASGSLGEVGVKPTYLITQVILSQILRQPPLGQAETFNPQAQATASASRSNSHPK